MNRRPDAPDPLSPEERDLADRLLRLGPNEGPSSALDAKILAAAHAAVAQTPRARANKTRWPAWIGVAASLSLAVGIAWQLRPMDKAAEAMITEQPVAASAADSAAAAPEAQDSIAGQGGAQQAADAAASAAAAETVAVPSLPAPAEPIPPARMIARPPQELAKRSNNADAGLAASANQATEQRREQAYSQTQQRDDVRAFPAPVMAPPPPPAPPTPMADSAPIADAAAPAAAASAPAPIARDAAKPGATAKSRQVAPAPAGLITAAEAEAPRGAQPAQQQSTQEGYIGAPEAKALKQAPADNTSLDTVTVTGSRISGPVEEDNKLPAAQWLDRIREYRDAEELDRARESLRLFRRSHPHNRIPEDLRPLLK